MKKLLIILSLFLLTACQKSAITPGRFKGILNKNNYEIIDKGKNNYDFVLESLIAVNENIQIEYYVLKNEKYAKKVFNKNKEDFEKSLNDFSAEGYTNNQNLEKYTVKDKTTYKVVAKIDNTVIFISENVSHQKEINRILKKLGY